MTSSIAMQVGLCVFVGSVFTFVLLHVYYNISLFTRLWISQKATLSGCLNIRLQFENTTIIPPCIIIIEILYKQLLFLFSKLTQVAYQSGSSQTNIISLETCVVLWLYMGFVVGLRLLCWKVVPEKPLLIALILSTFVVILHRLLSG